MAQIVLIQAYTGTWDEMSVRPPESLLAVAAVPSPFYDQAVKEGFKGPEKLEDWEHMEFDTWLRNYRSWSSPELVRKMEAISFSSYFANKNVEYKFSNSFLLRICFKLYHPVARWRFRNQ